MVVAASSSRQESRHHWPSSFPGSRGPSAASAVPIRIVRSNRLDTRCRGRTFLRDAHHYSPSRQLADPSVNVWNAERWFPESRLLTGLKTRLYCSCVAAVRIYVGNSYLFPLRPSPRSGMKEPADIFGSRRRWFFQGRAGKCAWGGSRQLQVSPSFNTNVQSRCRVEQKHQEHTRDLLAFNAWADREVVGQTLMPEPSLYRETIDDLRGAWRAPYACNRN